MELLITIVFIGLIAWLNHYLAEQRGRSPIGWAIGGVIFGLFATILLLILGETEEHRIDIINKANTK